MLFTFFHSHRLGSWHTKQFQGFGLPPWFVTIALVRGTRNNSKALASRRGSPPWFVTYETFLKTLALLRGTRNSPPNVMLFTFFHSHLKRKNHHFLLIFSPIYFATYDPM